MHSLTAFVLTVVVFASAWAWISVLRRLASRRVLLPQEPRRPVPWGLLDLLLTVLILWSGQAFASQLLQAKYQIEPGTRFEELAAEPRAALLLASALITLATFALSVSWIMVRSGARWDDLGWDVRKTFADLRLGVAAFFFLAPVVYGLQWILVQWLESKHPLLELLKENPDPWFFLLCGFSAVLVAPLAEEYLFRVLLQGWLERLPSLRGDPQHVLLGGRPAKSRADAAEKAIAPESWPAPAGWEPESTSSDNPYFPPAFAESPPSSSEEKSCLQDSPRPVWPILVSSSLFALAHWSHGPDPIPLFVLAVALGTIYQRTGRIIPCVVVHFLLNASSLAALWVAVKS